MTIYEDFDIKKDYTALKYTLCNLPIQTNTVTSSMHLHVEAQCVRLFVYKPSANKRCKFKVKRCRLAHTIYRVNPMCIGKTTFIQDKKNHGKTSFLKGTLEKKINLIK